MKFMKRFKRLGKITAMFLILIIGLSAVFSCGSNDNNSGSTTSTTSANTIEDTSVTTTEATEPPTTTEKVTEPPTEPPTDPAERPEPDENGIISGFRYYMRSQNSDLYLNVDGDFKYAGFTQEDFTGTPDQMFVFTKLDNGNYTIRVLGTKAAYIDTEDGIGDEDGKRLEATETPNAEGSHEWTVKLNTNGSYYIRSVISGSKKVIDVNGVSKDPGAYVHAWASAGGANQKWFLELVSDNISGTTAEPGN